MHANVIFTTFIYRVFYCPSFCVLLKISSFEAFVRKDTAASALGMDAHCPWAGKID
jgi:hypothetical protein